MTDPTKGWPDPLPNPFTLFGAAPPAAAPSGPTTAPMAQGLAGGVELFKKFWGQLPGGTALPGFLVPTVDVAELDKRIADLRAAESWLDVNVNLLRATIQGLEVQRHTIAAIQSISALGDPKAAAPGGAPAASMASGWPVPPAAAPAEAATAAPPAEPPPASTGPQADAGATLVSAAAGHWLGFMQDQFAKVAQAALATSTPATDAPPNGAKKAATTARSATKATARKRKPAPRKSVSR